MDDARIKIALTAIAASCCSVLILTGIYPYHPKSLIGWVVLYLISLPIVIIFEVLGEKVFSEKFSSKLGRGAWIIYGVMVLGLIMLLSISAVSWLEPHFGKWVS